MARAAEPAFTLREPGPVVRWLPTLVDKGHGNYMFAVDNLGTFVFPQPYKCGS